MATWLYDKIPPPAYPYTHATLAFSAAVQLYTRSGQLPTADNLYRKKIAFSNWCRFGCEEIEGAHHIFTRHLAFTELREKVSKDIEDSTNLILGKETLGREIKEEIQKRAECLFSDSEYYWPLHHNQYYLGHVPKFTDQLSISGLSQVKQERLAHNIHSNWHTVAIRLAGRIWIWGQALRKIAPKVKGPNGTTSN